MKSTFILLIVGVVIGITLGVGHSLYDLGIIVAGTAPEEVSNIELPDVSEGGLIFVPEDQPQPRVEVDESTFEFGRMGLGTFREHTFSLRNVGEATLQLREGKATCKCTDFSVAKKLLAPGEETTVYLKWRAESDPGPFQQSAPVYTNDRKKPLIDFVVMGSVDQSLDIVPRELNLGRVSIDAAASVSAKLLGFVEEPVQLIQHDFTRESTREFFELTTEEIPVDELNYPDAKSGLLVKVTLKPGLPLGMIDQRVRLITNLENGIPIELRIKGSVSSEITIAGDHSWNGQSNLLKVGMVKSDEGLVKRLRIMLSGAYRDETSFEITEVDPNILEVELGDSSALEGVPVTQVPLTIRLPKGSRPISRLGSSDNDPLGRIVLETTHPKVPQIHIYVQFAVER